VKIFNRVLLLPLGYISISAVIVIIS